MYDIWPQGFLWQAGDLQKDELVVGSIPHPSTNLLRAIGSNSNSDCGENMPSLLCTYTAITRSPNRLVLWTATWLAAALTLKLRSLKDIIEIGRSNFFTVNKIMTETKTSSLQFDWRPGFIKCFCFTACFYNIPKTKRKKFFFHSFSVRDTQTKTCFCFTQQSFVWLWNKNKMFLFHSVFWPCWHSIPYYNCLLIFEIGTK